METGKLATTQVAFLYKYCIVLYLLTFISFSTAQYKTQCVAIIST